MARKAREDAWEGVCVCVCVCVCFRCLYVWCCVYSVLCFNVLTLFHLAYTTASVYKRKNISAEVSDTLLVIDMYFMSVLVCIHGLNSLLRSTWFHASGVN